MSVLAELRVLGVVIRQSEGDRLRLGGLPREEMEELARAYAARKTELLAELASERAGLFSCPYCGRCDYRPLGNSERHCLCCGKTFCDSTDVVAVTNSKPRRHSQHLPCPTCATYAYSPGPAGLPQRRCHGCGEVWTP